MDVYTWFDPFEAREIAREVTYIDDRAYYERQEAERYIASLKGEIRAQRSHLEMLTKAIADTSFWKTFSQPIIVPTESIKS